MGRLPQRYWVLNPAQPRPLAEEYEIEADDGYEFIERIRNAHAFGREFSIAIDVDYD